MRDEHPWSRLGRPSLSPCCPLTCARVISHRRMENSCTQTTHSSIKIALAFI